MLWVVVTTCGGDAFSFFQPPYHRLTCGRWRLQCLSCSRCLPYVTWAPWTWLQVCRRYLHRTIIKPPTHWSHANDARTCYMYSQTYEQHLCDQLKSNTHTHHYENTSAACAIKWCRQKSSYLIIATQFEHTNNSDGENFTSYPLVWMFRLCLFFRTLSWFAFSLRCGMVNALWLQFMRVWLDNAKLRFDPVSLFIHQLYCLSAIPSYS